MGKQTNIKLRGTVENTIYYQWKDIHCMRTVPARVRQTPATKKEAANFGVAVKNAAIARSMFKVITQYLPPNRAIIYKTDGAFRKWLHTHPLNEQAVINHIPFFEVLSFNEEINFQSVIKAKVTISRGSEGQLLINWPECNPVTFVRAPAETQHVVIKYLAATIDMHNPGIYHYSEAAISFTYADGVMPAKEMVLENVTAPVNLALVAMSVWYYKDETENRLINSMRWKPAGIVGSFYN